MIDRILCPFHVESTPSCAVYDDHFFCYGCGKHGPLSALGLTVAQSKRNKPEDLAASLANIALLPKTEIRGLELPYDHKYYYVVWPTGDYYKKRAKTGDGSKYLCPTGCVKPMFVAQASKSDTLCVVEGEINAMSLALVRPPFSIISPGGAAEFASKRYIELMGGYSRYIIVADADKAGLDAAVRLKKELLKESPRVTIHLMERDCNEILIEEGLSGVQKEVQKMRGLA